MVRNILVVDDIEENRYMLVSLLSGNGYHVIAKSNGLEAFKYAKENPPDLVITDILMPVMDGFELCKQWKQDEELKSIPFIIYTATYTDAKDEKLALDLGADRFIIKPQKPEVLLEIIRTIIEEYKKQNRPEVESITADELSFLSQHRKALARKLSRKLRQLEHEVSQHRQTLRFLDSIIENIPSIIFIKEATRLTFVRFNKAGEKFLGISQNELIGKTDYDIFPTEQAEANVRADREVISNKRMVEIFEAQLYSKAKGNRIVHARKIPLFNEKDEVVFVLSIAEDITEQKQLAEEKNRLQQQIWQIQKLESIGRFAGSIAHDFNNLLSVILGYANLLLESFAHDDPRRAEIYEIYRAGESAAALCKQLLTFSRKQVLRATNVDLNKVVKGLQQMLRRLVPENISLEFVFSLKPAIVLTDPSQMEQLIMNLVVNSRDAMPNGGRLVISVAKRTIADNEIQPYEGKPGDYVELTVSDTGIGMNEDVLSHVFEPFYTTKEEGRGVGLGLSTVYGIVKQSGGFIRIESSVGVGTAVRIFLPESKETTSEDFVRDAKIDTTPYGERKIFLVVEDDEAVLALIVKMLSSFGYRVIAAKCCAEATQQMRSMSNIDVLLCDVVLPDGRGDELYETVKSIFPGLRVIFISGYWDDLLSKKISQLPHAAMILKPFSIQDLKERIASLLVQ
ncbi:MAG: response regulator [Spirochaetes bacterium]|nr:response regulator [Spirochaetota bacterium]